MVLCPQGRGVKSALHLTQAIENHPCTGFSLRQMSWMQTENLDCWYCIHPLPFASPISKCSWNGNGWKGGRILHDFYCELWIMAVQQMQHVGHYLDTVNIHLKNICNIVKERVFPSSAWNSNDCWSGMKSPSISGSFSEKGWIFLGIWICHVYSWGNIEKLNISGRWKAWMHIYTKHFRKVEVLEIHLHPLLLHSVHPSPNLLQSTALVLTVTLLSPRTWRAFPKGARTGNGSAEATASQYFTLFIYGFPKI